MTHTLIQGEVLDVLPTLGNFACCFLDPPDALGLKLNGYQDRPRKGYIEWLADVMAKTIPHCGVTWLSYNSQWDLAVKHWAYDYGQTHRDVEIKPFYQHYTFFQCNNNDCARRNGPCSGFAGMMLPFTRTRFECRVGGCCTETSGPRPAAKCRATSGIFRA